MPPPATDSAAPLMGPLKVAAAPALAKTVPAVPMLTGALTASVPPVTSRALVVRVPLPTTAWPLPMMMSELTVSPAAATMSLALLSLTFDVLPAPTRVVA